jgi:hypothetical protein
MMGDPDSYIFLLKHIPRSFAKSDRFTGMLNITGPPGGGKGTFLFMMKSFGGEGREYLVHNLGAGYLHDDKVRGAEDCKPVIAASKNKALLYCDEYPNRVMNIDTLKPLVEPRGGGVNARFGGARDDQGTSIDVTWGCILGVGNNPLKFPNNATGYKGKVNEIVPPYKFVNRGKVLHANEIEADPTFADNINAGSFDGEFFWLMCQLFRLIDDPRVVKGREFGPVPIRVLEQHDDVEGATAVMLREWL